MQDADCALPSWQTGMMASAPFRDAGDNSTVMDADFLARYRLAPHAAQLVKAGQCDTTHAVVIAARMQLASTHHMGHAWLTCNLLLSPQHRQKCELRTAALRAVSQPLSAAQGALPLPATANRLLRPKCVT